VAKSADRYFLPDTQKIVEKGFDPEHALVSESIFSLANEHMGVRGYFEEGGGPSLRGCYLGGVYETAPHRPESEYRGFVDRTHYMVTAADCLRVTLAVGGEKLDLSACAFRDFTRVLELRTGLLTRSFLWQTRNAGRVEVRFERLLGMERPELLAQRLTLCALDRDAEVTLAFAVDGNMVHSATGQCLWNETGERLAENALELRTATTGITVRYTLLVAGPGEKTRERGFRTITESRRFTLAKGKETAAERVTAVQVAYPGEALAPSPAFAAFDALLAENTRHWRAFWDACDVTVEGDAEQQQGIRYCLFQLHSTYRGLDARNNIGAKGLTGEAYSGHAFWDTETYCLPFYLFSDTKAARNLLMYRYRALPMARERAAAMDLAGACYPVATLDGTEACTLWQHSSLQMQPSTAVAYAVETYARLTGDEAFLRREGAEMLCEIARYVLSRGEWNQHGFGFYGVMGPDEFHMMVSNDFYTNFMGKKTLLQAADTVERLAGSERAALARKIALKPEEPAAWRRAAEKMIFLRRADGVYEQHEGYFNLPHTNIRDIPATEFPLYEHWSYDRIYRSDMLKQPDVLMAMYLHPEDFSAEEIAANYAYYEPRCVHESSLSPSVHAILAGALGRRGEAARLFGFAVRLDLDNYNRNTCEGLHLSSAAAAWVTMTECFGGLRFDGDTLRLAPWLAEGWKRFGFSLRVRGSLLRVSVQTGGVTLACGGKPIVLTLYGETLTVGETPVTRPKEG